MPYTYVPFGVSDLPGALTGMRALGIRGFGMSVPFKQQIMPLLDELDPLAERIGAVNTVVNEAGRLIGYNTDCVGAVRALETALALDGATVLLLGAGGAARAVAHGLKEAGAQLVISNRSEDKGQELAHSVAATWRPWPQRSCDDCDGVINATTVGMASAASESSGEDSPLPDETMRPGLVVMDIVYKPIETALLRAARKAGARPIHGGRMLLYQAVRQFELYTGRDAPVQAMRQALERAIAEQERA